MTNKSMDEDEMPPEIDFSNASRGLHHVPADATVFLPAAIERSVQCVGIFLRPGPNKKELASPNF